MDRVEKEKQREGRGILFHAGGRTYFTKRTERTFFFVLTVILMLWGLLVKFGVWGG